MNNRKYTLVELSDTLIRKEKIPPWITLRVITGCNGSKGIDGKLIHDMVFGVTTSKVDFNYEKEVPRFVQCIVKFIRDHDGWTPSTHYVYPNFIKTKIFLLHKWWKRGDFLSWCTKDFMMQLFSEIAKESKLSITVYVYVRTAMNHPYSYSFCVEFWIKPHDICPLCKDYEPINTARNDKAYFNGALICNGCTYATHRCLFCQKDIAVIIPGSGQSDNSQLFCMKCNLGSSNLDSAVSVFVKE